MYNYLDFEGPVRDLDGKILELKKLSESGEAVDVADEIARLEKRSRDALRDAYKALNPWQRAQVARHPDRPHCLDYVQGLFTDFTALAGDRSFGEDEAIVGGFARFRGEPVAVIGQEKGNDTKSRLRHNFGMARPEGYRKAIRIMDLADRFGLPVVTLVDTAGAYSIYSVISPEGAASILWRDSTRARDAATNMKITAQDLLGLKVIDGIIAEPVGGAHREPEAAIEATGRQIAAAFDELKAVNEDYREHRRQKYLSIGR